MSIEEYSEKLLELTKKETEAKRCYLEAKRAVINLKKEHCYSLVEQFKTKIGKKVVVHQKTSQGSHGIF